MSIDLGGKVKPSFSQEQFNWFVKNGIEKFLKLAGKAPAESGRRKHTKTFSSVAKHIQGGFNLGVELPHGVVVLDIDARADKDGFAALGKLLEAAYPPEGRPSIDDLIKSTFAVRSGGGGLHLYFRHDPAKKARGSLRDYKGVDIKASNAGYLVAPGSVHPDTGKAYTVENQPEELAPLPVQLAAFVMEGIREPAATLDEPSSPHAKWGMAKPAELACLLDVLDPMDFREYCGDKTAWINLMTASHHATAGNLEAMAVFSDWSARDSKFEDEAHKEVELRWHGWKERRNGGHVATLGSLLGLVKEACESASFVGENDDRHTRALELVKDIEARIVALDLEPLADSEAGNLLAWIESPEGAKLKGDPKTQAEVIIRISKLPEVSWPELTSSLSSRTSGALSPLKIQKLVQKEVTKREKEARDGKPTQAEIVHKTMQGAIQQLAGEPANLATPPTNEPYIYKTGCWKKLASNAIGVACWDALKPEINLRERSTWPADKYVQHATNCVLKETATTSEALYRKTKPPCCINLLDKTLWFYSDGTYELKPHNRDDMLTNQIPYKYDASATCPSFDTMLRQVFAKIARDFSEEELDAFIDYFWELIGYIIQQDKDIEVMIFWLGRGLNGKSKISKIICKLIGEDSILPANVENFFNPQNPHNTYALLGKQLVIDDEGDKSARIKDGELKKLCCNNEIQVNPKNKDSIKIAVHPTLLMISNYTPVLEDACYGFRRRVFPVYFEERLYHLRDSPLPKKAEMEEIPGILNRSIEGLARLRKRGRFDPPASALAFLNRFLVSAHSVLGFWHRLPKVKDDSSVFKTEDLFTSYNQYMRDSAFGKPQNIDHFIYALEEWEVNIDYDTVKGWRLLPKTKTNTEY